MPELPEVETIRRDLDKEVNGKRIKTVEATGMRTIRRHTNRKQFAARLEGRKIDAITRRGKYLLLKLDNNDVLVIHLGMSGQLLRAKGVKDEMAKHTHVVITFTQGGQLRFIDPRTFGEMFVTTSEEIETAVPELSHLGFDPIEEMISWDRFGLMLHTRKTKLKTLMMDQKFIAGIGNIYADEILFGAGLRPERDSESLTSQEIRRLYRSMIEILHDAIKYRGSSLADEQYRDLFGKVGDFQSQHKVYDREGEACRRCRAVIVRQKTNGRSTFLCEQCQV